MRIQILILGFKGLIDNLWKIKQKYRYILLQLLTHIQPTYKENLLPCVKEIQRSHRDHLLPEKFKKQGN